MEFLIFVGVVAVVAGLVVVGVAAEKKRLRKTIEVLRGLGIQAVGKPELDEVAASQAMAELGRLSFKTGAAGVKWTGTGVIRGRRIRVLEHTYTTGSGKNRTTHINTVVATPCPAAWPDLQLMPEHLGIKVAKMFMSSFKDVQVENAEFNKKWLVKCDNEDFAILLLTPEVQQKLCIGKALGAWWIGGAVCRVIPRRLPPEELPGLIADAVEFFELLPPSLEAWGAPTPGRSDG